MGKNFDPQHVQSQLGVVKAIKQVGEKIILMLAQLENFQRKLWLKKIQHASTNIENPMGHNKDPTQPKDF